MSPYKPRHPCLWPDGCGNLTYNRFCSVHAAQYERQRRPTAAARGYDAQWRSVRVQVLREHPYCQVCGQPSVEVDHITPMSKGGARLARWNLQALCRSCHHRKHGKAARQ